MSWWPAALPARQAPRVYRCPILSGPGFQCRARAFHGLTAEGSAPSRAARRHRRVGRPGGVPHILPLAFPAQHDWNYAMHHYLVHLLRWLLLLPIASFVSPHPPLAPASLLAPAVCCLQARGCPAPSWQRWGPPWIWRCGAAGSRPWTLRRRPTGGPRWTRRRWVLGQGEGWPGNVLLGMCWCGGGR